MMYEKNDVTAPEFHSPLAVRVKERFTPSNLDDTAKREINHGNQRFAASGYLLAFLRT